MLHKLRVNLMLQVLGILKLLDDGRASGMLTTHSGIKPVTRNIISSRATNSLKYVHVQKRCLAQLGRQT